MSRPTVYLVDASPYIFRAYFSISSELASPSGDPANAAYGFARFLLELMERAAVEHVALAFDRSLTTSFRNEVYPAYKAQRELPPEALEAQLGWCERWGEALGCACFVDERYEADDLIAGVRRRLDATDAEFVIVTSDKDLAQLVDARTTLWDYARDERLGPAEVVAKFGVRPEQIVDYLGLAGDSVDNIPGVRGVGPKSAAALLAHFPNLEALYGDLGAVGGLPIRGAKSLAAKLEAHRDQAFLSRRLATVATDKPATLALEAVRYPGADRAAVEALARELGFERLRDRVARWAGDR